MSVLCNPSFNASNLQFTEKMHSSTTDNAVPGYFVQECTWEATPINKIVSKPVNIVNMEENPLCFNTVK